MQYLHPLNCFLDIFWLAWLIFDFLNKEKELLAPKLNILFQVFQDQFHQHCTKKNVSMCIHAHLPFVSSSITGGFLPVLLRISFELLVCHNH